MTNFEYQPAEIPESEKLIREQLDDPDRSHYREMEYGEIIEAFEQEEASFDQIRQGFARIHDSGAETIAPAEDYQALLDAFKPGQMVRIHRSGSKGHREIIAASPTLRIDVTRQQLEAAIVAIIDIPIKREIDGEEEVEELSLLPRRDEESGVMVINGIDLV